MSTSDLTTRTDLAWLANCYALGELSAAEAVAFEARLAADEVACNAVANAMQWNLAIAAAIESEGVQSVETVIPAARFEKLGYRAAAAALAASLALMVGRGLIENGIARKDGADRIVAAWASGEAVRNAANDDDDGLDSDDNADLDPPDWLLAALTAEQVKEQIPEQDDVRDN